MISHAFNRFVRLPLLWLDSTVAPSTDGKFRFIDFVRAVPFALVHVACFAVIWVGFSWVALGVAVASYVARMFAITAFYHRYFSHRAYKTSRWVQFLFAFAGGTSAQRGALWWAAHHRHHHRHSDQPGDVHSPHRDTLWWSHVGWITSPKNAATDLNVVNDLARYPELRFLNRFDVLAPLVYALGMFMLGWGLQLWKPAWGTNGWQMLIWGFFISTVFVYHCTFMINSLAHLMGTRRFETKDLSRNNFFLAIITLGEGWHNNHHRFPGAARQGLRWWEIDISYYMLLLMERVGLIWDLNPMGPRPQQERDRQPS